MLKQAPTGVVLPNVLLHSTRNAYSEEATLNNDFSWQACRRASQPHQYSAPDAEECRPQCREGNSVPTKAQIENGEAVLFSRAVEHKIFGFKIYIGRKRI